MVEEHDEVENLVTRARSGDLEAFEMLFRAHQAGIYSFVRSQIRNAEAAADLTQETFVRAWESLPRLRRPGAFRGWLHQIAGNLVRDEVKSGRVRLEVVESVLAGDGDGSRGGLPEHPSSDDNPEERLLEEERSEAIRAALEELPEEQRAAVVMHHMEGMRVHEIAEAMGVRPGTIMSRLARAREALRSRLSQYVEESDE
jgi:RNA polymerase sigma-70 factor (ECF subfamily)